MELQSRISWELNQEMVGRTLRCMIDRKQGPVYIGRTYKDSPEVDNEVHIEAGDTYLRPGEFVNVRITSAQDFDLYGTCQPVGS
jgi:ribosomal protein S12 methylthiotransferase